MDWNFWSGLGWPWALLAIPAILAIFAVELTIEVMLDRSRQRRLRREERL